MIKLIILQLSVFVGLLIVLWIIFHGQLNNALKRLNVSLKSSLQKEEELKTKKAELEEERQNQINKGKQEAKEIVEAAKKEALQYKDNLKAEADKEKEFIIQKGQQEIEKIKRSVNVEVEEKSVSVAKDLIKHLLSDASHQVLHDEIIKDAAKEIEAMDKERFKVTPDAVQLIAARQLKEQEKENIKAILKDKLGKDVDLKEEVKESLIAGFILHIDSMVIDASLKNRLRKIIPLLKK
jgi:F-type H+-transporting ATPase subunit b